MASLFFSVEHAVSGGKSGYCTVLFRVAEDVPFTCGGSVGVVYLLKKKKKKVDHFKLSISTSMLKMYNKGMLSVECDPSAKEKRFSTFLFLRDCMESNISIQSC